MKLKSFHSNIGTFERCHLPAVVVDFVITDLVFLIGAY
jgi:hypothetical protein